ncbi:HAD-superfamily hydrolase, partial [Jimgerdemannia flammicorona]
DRGLAYITGRTDWRELFDAVVVSADKPNFYRSNRPFRRITESTWAVVDAFHRGEVYQGGNLLDFSRFTGCQRVMYIGDHVFSDLEEPNIQQGWRTGAIIRELQTEIQIRNTPSYRQTLSWLLHLENLIRQAQTANMEQRTPELQHLLDSWRNERRNIRRELKIVFNRQFGSVFRTHHNPTWFANKIKRTCEEWDA